MFAVAPVGRSQDSFLESVLAFCVRRQERPCVLPLPCCLQLPDPLGDSPLLRIFLEERWGCGSSLPHPAFYGVSGVQTKVQAGH